MLDLKTVVAVVAGLLAGVALVLSCGVGPDEGKAQEKCDCNVTNTVKAKTASTDPDAYEFGTELVTTSTPWQKDGPFVLNRLQMSSGEGVGGGVIAAFTVDKGSKCQVGGSAKNVITYGLQEKGNYNIFSSPFVIKEGRTFCIGVAGINSANKVGLYWGGFKPY